MATAPAPALSIVTEYKTDGPVTKTLIPLAVIDDVIAICVFLSVMGIVLHQTANGSVPGNLMILVIGLPILIGILTGYPTALILRKIHSPKQRAAILFGGVILTATITLFLVIGLPILIGILTGYPTALILRKIHSPKQRAAILFGGVILTATITLFVNTYLMPLPILNFMMSGMVYSAVFSNLLEESVLEDTMKYCNPIVGACFTLIILNLGAPLDYHLILGAGIFTAVYIISRSVGKMGGAALGAQLSHAAPTVRKYLGMTILPHSGVSLVLTGIAISALTGNYQQYGDIVRGTIAAAAVINEIIAVFIARQGFKLAGEIGKASIDTQTMKG